MFSVDTVVEVITNGGTISYGKSYIRLREGCRHQYVYVKPWNSETVFCNDGPRKAAVDWLSIVDPIAEPVNIDLPKTFMDINIQDLECFVQKSQPVLPAPSDYDASKCLSLICQSPPGTKVSWSSENTQDEKKT